MSKITLSAVLDALRTVYDPDLKKDLVTLGMIQDLELKPETGEVSFRIVLTTPACPLKAQIEKSARDAVSQVPGVQNVAIKMDAVVRGAKPGASAGSPQASTKQQLVGVANIIAVSSGKGGVGKSTVAANLAASLAASGASVGIIDADVYGPNLPTMLGVVQPPTMRQDAERGELLIPPVAASGLKVMSMGFLTQPDQPLVWRGPMLHSVIQQFFFKVDWGNLDYLIVDLPPGTGDVQLSLAQLIPVTAAVLVTTPQEVSAQDVRKAYAMFEKVRIPVLGVVENMSYFICDGCEKRHELFGRGGGEALARKYDIELLSRVPLEPAVREAGDLGKPHVLTQSGEAARCFQALSERVAQKISVLQAESAAPESRGAAGIEIGSFH